MDLRYAVSEIRKNASNRQWWRKRFLTHVVSRYYTDVAPPNTERLVDTDWDNVLLLDACRYDLFEEVLGGHPLPGELSMRRSSQSGTPGYLAENFANEKFHDIVYVTANPYVNTELDESQFHAVVPVWRDGWSDEVQTVTPETVLEHALEANNRFPEKRLIVHFNQPHAPFIGEKRLGGRKASAIRQRALGRPEPDPRERVKTPFERLGDGEVTREEVWAAYRSNLERAFPAVEELLDVLEGLTAVTSDHGNALGEFARPFPIRVYGHPLGILIPALTEVPWHTHLRGERKRVTEEAPDGLTAGDDEAMTEETATRLRMLGYAE